MTGIRRALAPVLLAAAALAAAFAVERSLACPVRRLPQPLRTLYKVSERIVVARVGAKEVLEVDAEAETASVRFALHVTENVKGPPAELVYLHRDEYAGKDAAEAADEEEAVVNFEGRAVPRLKRGERYLFFLDPREGGGYEVNDESYGIKRLSDEDLKVYLERMKELAEMTRRGGEDKHALVEWLVRCAERPATRWEGAYELVDSAEAATRGPDLTPEFAALAARLASETSAAGGSPAAPQPQAAEAPTAAEAAAPPGETGVEIQRLPMPVSLRYTPPDPELAALLNAVQKQRLCDALFATDAPGEGDDELMHLVKDMGDPRFPAFVLARLHRLEEDPPVEAEPWLRALASALRNERIVKLAEAYTQEATYYEEEETEAAETEAAPETNGEEGTAEEAEETPVDPEVEAARVAAATERATRKRSAMFKSVLAAIDLFVSTGQLARN